jgi:hypothetical protein
LAEAGGGLAEDEVKKRGLFQAELHIGFTDALEALFGLHGGLCALSLWRGGFEALAQLCKAMLGELGEQGFFIGEMLVGGSGRDADLACEFAQGKVAVARSSHRLQCG